jgi:uncharacterized membrane protein YraQ (UPF0718 family)
MKAWDYLEIEENKKAWEPNATHETWLNPGSKKKFRDNLRDWMWTITLNIAIVWMYMFLQNSYAGI